MPKIELNRLKEIIQEEVTLLREGESEDSAAKIMSTSTKLLKAIETFKKSASEVAKSELGTNLETVERVLKRIASSPMQYIDQTKPPTKKVSLRPQKQKML